MTVIGGRGGRQDDWSSPHARPRARAAARVDGPLDPDEGAWLDEHLASCEDCSAIAADYGTQHLELHTLRDRPPVPPRDLWARTSAAIERESRHRSPRRTRASSLRPYALLTGALVVAVVVGTLSSSQRPVPDATTAPGPTAQIAAGTPSPRPVAPTPFAIDPKDVAYVTEGPDGEYLMTTTRIEEVCPQGATECKADELRERREVIGPPASAEASSPAEGQPLVVVGAAGDGSSIVAVMVPKPATGGGSDPSESPAATATATPTATPTNEGASPPPETATPTEPVAASPDVSPAPPSDEPT